MILDLDASTFNKISSLWSIVRNNNGPISISYLTHLMLKDYSEIQLYKLLNFASSYQIINIDENKGVAECFNFNDINHLRTYFIKNYFKNNFSSFKYANILLKGRSKFINHIGKQSNIYQILNDAGLAIGNSYEAAVFWKFVESLGRNNINTAKSDNGIFGEQLTINIENFMLEQICMKLNIPVKTSKWIAIDRPYAGFDVGSYYQDKKGKFVKKYIEVKTSRDIMNGRMYITWNEWRRMKRKTHDGMIPEKYHIHLWDIKNKTTPHLAILNYSDIAPLVPILKKGCKIDSFNIDVRRFYDESRFTIPSIYAKGASIQP
jgi:hypothetical protein